MRNYILHNDTNLESRHTHGAGLMCAVCERARTLNDCELTAELSVLDAFEIWISHRVLKQDGMVSNAHYLSERTEWDYRQYARALVKFFGEIKLDDIHAGHLREYQRGRAFCDQSAAKWDKQAGANRIRKEIGMLISIMKSAGAWNDRLQLQFQRLRPVENDVPRAMSPDEQHNFLHAASSKEEWQFIYWYALLALQTTASTNELRGLRLGDVLLHQGVIQIRSATAKNKFRVRSIPLETPEVVWAIERLIDRAHELGSSGPHHYLFPFALSKKAWDPCKSMSDSGLKKKWAAVRKTAGLPWLRPYDLRHTAITRMAESGVPLPVIMSFAGHMTMRMQQHYTTISMASKRQWAQNTWSEAGQRRPQLRVVDKMSVG